MVMNINEKSRYNRNALIQLLNTQIHNSLDLGWDTKKIIIMSNIDYEYMNIKTINTQLNNFCLTGSKMFGLLEYIKKNEINESIWAHDLDAIQNVSFNDLDFNDVGIAQYSNNKFNGGSVFWKSSAIDIIQLICDQIIKDKLQREEPTLNKILKSKEYSNRVTILNNTWNVGCSGYAKRYNKSFKPIHVCHFHPNNRLAWETHALNRTGTGVSISYRLEKLIRKYYNNLATELSFKGKIRQQQKIKEMKNERQEHCKCT